MFTIPVPLGDRTYNVIIGDVSVETTADCLAKVLGRATGVALLVDEQLGRSNPRVTELQAALAARLPRLERLDLAAGEACKSFAQLEATCDWLASQGFDRGAAIVAIGGGATSDHAGFAASIYLRGIQFALVPTTLLAMVDASVGGKTAVDLKAGKNLVGAFHQPRLVVADLNFLTTLPARELAAGMAEVVKAGLIADAALFASLESQSTPAHEWPRERLADAIAAAVKVKVAVVAEDERESGRRAILNFGHTLGHAMESGSNYGLLHGEAVSLGMLAALRLGELRGKSPPELRVRTEKVLNTLALPTDVAKHLTPSVLKHVEVDKKRRSNDIRFVFVPFVGDAIVDDVPLTMLHEQAATMF
ncbi:MAG: 3-dehydroquinate synthase [Deltaproteobacteria bacterium]|nr:3-dehydroquinate synthase [Deltaproteobacteria bacterium]